MRALLISVLVLTTCTTQPNSAASPTPTPTSSPTATPTPTSSPTPTPSPIALPSFAQLSAPSGTVVWALVGGTRLFRSSDRGDRWIERSLPFGVANAEVAFSDGQTGDLLRDHGLLLSTASPATQCQSQVAAIWQTSDGAGQWQKVSSTGIADAMCKSGLASIDATHALFTAWTYNTAPVVYRTADAGQSWQPSTALPDPPGFTTQSVGIALRTGRPRAFGSIVLVDAVGLGLASGEATHYVFRSTDSGASWTYASTAPISNTTVAFLSAARWVQIGPPGESKQTLDGGAVWLSYTTDYSQAAPIAPDLVFGDAAVGYATVRGGITRTTDGGAHWTTIKTPGT